ncbi:hypothetical protein [Chitinophaga filiformis]|uniref:Uncharacterized protein n=1 Tax=Chitinophaga filiformis TaxID=104663 RepID=A0A1G7HP53_CHIFI|nr:hypothetical protein [Chitinophaga filiformis]SDF02044.1 hypothetical protein SAMN04488121_101544 [Chitinophaga filiformis]
MITHYTELLDTFDKAPIEDWAAYFHDNAERIDTLIKFYEAYNKHVMNAQAKRIHEIKKSICQITGDNRWSDLEGLELSYDEFEPRIYIRGSFNSTAEDPIATFNIHILAPTVQAWNHYENQLLSRYTAQEPLIAGNKTILQVFTAPGQQEKQILEALQEVYLFVSSLTLKNFLHPLTSH